MKYVIKWIAWILVVIGALNWGLVGFFNFDLVTAIFGSMSYIIYDIVGLSALVLIIFKCFKHKMKKK
jgi:uncharacterized membrane protein YuzA (DUF378 family)